LLHQGLITHVMKLTPASALSRTRNSVGGKPILPAELPWPRCSCGERLVMFFQFDVQQRFGLPFRSGSHFSAFMCPAHNDPPESLSSGMGLPKNYWKRRHAQEGVKDFYQLVLHLPGTEERLDSLEPHLLHQSITFERRSEPTAEPLHPGVSVAMSDSFKGLDAFKVGGQPHFVHGTDGGTCTCGARLVFLCQVPNSFGFPRAKGALEQPDTFNSDYYTLFLGNFAYIFACEAQCNPLAVYPFV
jgi:hypothetical protein